MGEHPIAPTFGLELQDSKGRVKAKPPISRPHHLLLFHQPHAHKCRNSRLLLRHAVENVRRLHGAVIVRDDDELRRVRELAQQSVKRRTLL